MMLEIKIRKIGNSLGLVLPKAALAHLKAGAGDMVVLTESAEEADYAPWLQANSRES